MHCTWLTGISSVLFIASLTGCSDQPSTHPPATVTSGALKLYAELCASCHGGNARGGAVGPDLTASRFKYGKNKAALEKSIFAGRPGGMPAFGSSLKPDQVTELADYILVLQ